MALEVEQKTYEHELSNLLPQEGKFVVISGEKIVGIYDTYPDALRIGYEKCGLKDFLVKKIEAVEQVQNFTRDIEP